MKITHLENPAQKSEQTGPIEQTARSVVTDVCKELVVQSFSHMIALEVCGLCITVTKENETEKCLWP